MKQELLSMLPPDFPWGESLHFEECVDSTNRVAKALADSGAPHGTAVLARRQTGGRGRLGRSFHSPEGGLYLSVILRPPCQAEALMHLTCAAGVAAAEAVEEAAGVTLGLKWINDLTLNSKKLGGILTELSLLPDGTVRYCIIGIGINCNCRRFPEELAGLATSLYLETGKEVSPARLGASLLQKLEEMDRALLTCRSDLMDRYRRRCITIGKQVVLQRPGYPVAQALDVDAQGGLIVEYADHTRETLAWGEVSVRGTNGYI